MLEDIKSLLDITNNSKDAKINAKIKLVKAAIQNECNRDDFPPELENVVVDYIVKESMNATSVTARGSVSFEHNVSPADLEEYEPQLARFRQVRVV
ncbi:phage head-tail connector protein [Salimicrobium halophilum]|uniref:Phage gp6-like head-tail connector protein n=1 Tax=Salimicrobium halophilum TaxID=86666 RepID=A0A1G8WDW5_9BACI|nr:phage head-tail connector protein [Salimicrobium halophilum]SDJ76316.1 Phage gp6-like head-tail connector protein [Salimicrobium halophilum]